MDKMVYIRDYNDTKKAVTINSFEDVEKITVSIQSGDEILTVYYKDLSTVDFDSSDCRLMNFFDGEYELPLDKIDDFSAFDGSSYDCERKFDSYYQK